MRGLRAAEFNQACNYRTAKQKARRPVAPARLVELPFRLLLFAFADSVDNPVILEKDHEISVFPACDGRITDGVFH